MLMKRLVGWSLGMSSVGGLAALVAEMKLYGDGNGPVG